MKAYCHKYHIPSLQTHIFTLTSMGAILQSSRDFTDWLHNLNQ